jgi:thiol-disulfide isomerase/thioredoxin
MNVVVDQDIVRMGMRVQRGPDWILGDRDGFEFNLGTIKRFVPNHDDRVFVDWDGELVPTNCRIGGTGNKYDLVVAPANMTNLDDESETTPQRQAAPPPQYTDRQQQASRQEQEGGGRRRQEQEYQKKWQQQRAAQPDGIPWPLVLMMILAALYIGSKYGALPSDDDDETVDAGNAFMHGKIKEVRTHEEFKNIIARHKDDTNLPIVVDFYSPSCGPCHMIAPAFKRMAKEYKHRAVFLKVDVNRNYQTSSELRIRSMPTFHWYAGGKKRHELSGADERGIRHYTSSITSRRPVYVGVEVTPASLEIFYRKHEPKKIGEIRAILKKHKGK